MIGRTVSHYRILEKLGEGGMGVIYKAQDERLRRPVVLKFLSQELTSDEGAKTRFINEARAASTLQHNNICTIHEIDETTDGQMFICMDYYDGETLRQKIRSGQLAVDDVVATTSSICAGLDKAHAQGIIHRDIKPANLIVTTDGVIKIVDFGVAKLTGVTRLTKSNMAMGTLGYMSPEQIRGETVDARSDIFSLGVVLYELLTATPAFDHDNHGAILWAVMNDDPKPVAKYRDDVPLALQEIVSKAIAKRPEDRFHSAVDMRDALHAMRAAPGATAYPKPTPSAVHAEIDSLAVLPFVNDAGDPEMEYLSDGLTDTLIDNLCQLPRLRVMARSTMFQYVDKDVSPSEVGRTLGVRAVLTGRLSMRADGLVVRAELVDTVDGTRLWGERFKRPAADILDIEEEISREISQNLRLRLNPEDRERLAKRQTESPEAYQAYLKGRHVWNRWKTPEGMRTAIGFFEKALEIDPLYALAFAGLADSYSVLGNVKAVPPGEAYPKAKTAAQQGLAIDDAVAELHTSLGFIHRFWDWDWAAAEAEFKRAIALNPGYATAYRWYGQLLCGLGRSNEAIAMSSRAVELDPLSLLIRGALGDIYFYARQYDTAIGLYQKTLEMDPEFLAGHTDLARSYELTGRYDEAVREFETAAALAPKGPPEPSSGLAHVYAQMGEHKRARAILDQLVAMRDTQYVSPYGIASIYSCLHDVDAAFEWLEKAYAEHDQTLVWIKVHPRLDPVRPDPRYDDLLKRMNL